MYSTYHATSVHMSLYCMMLCICVLVDLEVFYLGHLKNFYTLQYNTIQYPS